MDVRFRQERLDRLEIESGDGGLPPEVVRAYRKRIQWIRAATDEREFYEFRSLHYKKLRGQRKNQRSMRLNDQWRLILELEGEGADKTVWIVDIDDYH